MHYSEVVELKAAFVNAAYGKIGPAIIRCTAEVEDDVLLVQFVMRYGFDELDLDEARDIIGDLVGASPTLRGKEEVFELHDDGLLQDIDPRRILLYRVSDRTLNDR